MGFLGFEVRITDVPRASSSATLSTWIWYPSAAERGLGTATNWWRNVSRVLSLAGDLKEAQTTAKTDVLEQAQHLVVGGVIWDEEPNIGIPKHRSDSNQTRSSAWDDADILPCVLTVHSLSVVIIVKVSNSFSERLDAGCRSIFASVDGDWDRGRSWKGSFNVIVDFGGALTEVRPLVWLV